MAKKRNGGTPARDVPPGVESNDVTTMDTYTVIELTPATVRDLYELNPDRNPFTDAEKSFLANVRSYPIEDENKLGTIEQDADVNLTGAETVALIDTELGSSDWRTGQAAAGAPIRKTFDNGTGIVVDAEFWGVDPILGGSGGEYTITAPVGCVWKSYYVEALNTSTATDGSGDITITLVNLADIRDWCNAELTEFGDNEVLDDTASDSGIKRTQNPIGTDRIQNIWTDVQPLSGFGIFLSR